MQTAEVNSEAARHRTSRRSDGYVSEPVDERSESAAAASKFAFSRPVRPMGKGVSRFDPADRSANTQSVADRYVMARQDTFLLPYPKNVLIITR